MPAAGNIPGRPRSKKAKFPERVFRATVFSMRLRGVVTRQGARLMKTLTILTAAAALAAGLSVASAQVGSEREGQQPQATGSGKFCIETSPGGAWNCKFATMAACEKEAQPNKGACYPNPRAGTTGAR
jgi:hypothetical protein